MKFLIFFFYFVLFFIFRNLNLNIMEDLFFLNFNFFKSFFIIFEAAAGAIISGSFLIYFFKSSVGSFKKFKAEISLIPAVIVLFFAAEISVHIFAGRHSSGITRLFLRNLFIIAALYPVFNFKYFFEKEFLVKDTAAAASSYIFLCAIFIVLINIFNLRGNIGLTKALSPSYLSLFFYLFLTGVFIPYSEEIVFKYFLFLPLAKKLNFWIGAAIVSGIFAFLHQGGIIINIFRFLFSFWGCFLFYKTRRITAPFLLHSFFNLTVYGAAYYILG